MSHRFRARRPGASAGVIAALAVWLIGCGEDELPVVPDATAAPAGGDAAPGAGAAPAADPIGDAISGGDPTLPPGRKE